MNNPMKKWAKVLNRQLTKYRWQISIWKDVQHHMSSRNCKIQQWDTTTHLLQRLKSKTLMTPNVSEDVKQEGPSVTFGGSEKWYCHFGRHSLPLSYKTKHSLTYYSAIILLGIYPKELKTYVHTKTCIQMFIGE